MKITQKHLDELKKIVDENLELRGVNVETTLTVKEVRGKEYIGISSTNFQTVPAIHKNLSITEFGGFVTEDKDKAGFLNVWIPVHVSYEGNGVSLFNLDAFVRTDEDYVGVSSVEHKLGN